MRRPDVAMYRHLAAQLPEGDKARAEFEATADYVESLERQNEDLQRQLAGHQLVGPASLQLIEHRAQAATQQATESAESAAQKRIPG